MRSWLIALMVGVIFLAFLISSCDKLGHPDIRKEQVTKPDLKPDYFGWRWDWKW